MWLSISFVSNQRQSVKQCNKYRVIVNSNRKYNTYMYHVYIILHTHHGVKIKMYVLSRVNQVNVPLFF
jgi:hypothetical protein